MYHVGITADPTQQLLSALVPVPQEVWNCSSSLEQPESRWGVLPGLPGCWQGGRMCSWQGEMLCMRRCWKTCVPSAFPWGVLVSLTASAASCRQPSRGIFMEVQVDVASKVGSCGNCSA